MKMKCNQRNHFKTSLKFNYKNMFQKPGLSELSHVYSCYNKKPFKNNNTSLVFHENVDVFVGVR